MQVVSTKRASTHKFQQESGRYAVLQAIKRAGPKGVSMETLKKKFPKMKAGALRGCVNKLRDLKAVRTAQ